MSASVSRRSARKRRHSTAFSETNDAKVHQAEPANQVPEEPISDEKEAEIWESFREENFETIEQLPLSLHRQFTLMKELEENAQDNQKKLLPQLQGYINIRKALAALSQSTTSNAVQPNIKVQCYDDEATNDSVPISSSDEADASPMNVDAPTQTVRLTACPELRNNHPPNSIADTSDIDGSKARQLLMQVACLSEEIMRQSEEKVNLAQAIYDSVDRHIKMTEQAIIKQEIILLKGPSTDISGKLPDIHPPDDGNYQTKKSNRGTTIQVSTTPIDEEQDGDEILYCYCRKGSYGAMVGCDNDGCQIEWFHLECVGLKTLPAGNEPWYCKECTRTLVFKTRGRNR